MKLGLCISTLALVACTSNANDVDTASSALEEDPVLSKLSDPDSPSCKLSLVESYDWHMQDDIRQTVAPRFNKGGRVTVPGAITSTTVGHFTYILTVAGTDVSPSDPPSYDDHDERYDVSIYGSSPDTNGNDRAAYKLMSAMERGVAGPGARVESRDGRFKCWDMGFKGGPVHACRFYAVTGRREVTAHSHLCATDPSP